MTEHTSILIPSATLNEIKNWTSKEFQETILKNIVQPAYIEDLKSGFRSRLRWRNMSRVFIWTSNAFVLFGGIFSFLQVQLHDTTYWSIIAGICNVVALVIMNFSLDARKEEVNLTHDLNDVLRALGLGPFVNEDSHNKANAS